MVIFPAAACYWVLASTKLYCLTKVAQGDNSGWPGIDLLIISPAPNQLHYHATSVDCWERCGLIFVKFWKGWASSQETVSSFSEYLEVCAPTVGKTLNLEPVTYQQGFSISWLGSSAVLVWEFNITFQWNMADKERKPDGTVVGQDEND